jgi:hypothetical protein
VSERSRRWCASRYLRPPWIACDLESKELLALCLKKVTGLKECKLVDAGFVWTEPHSRRIKVKLTIQKELDSGAKLQQAFVIEYTVNPQQCDVCQRSYTNNTWGTCVQLRQKVRSSSFHMSQSLTHRVRSMRPAAYPHCRVAALLTSAGGPQEDVLLPGAGDSEAQGTRADDQDRPAARRLGLLLP